MRFILIVFSLFFATASFAANRVENENTTATIMASHEIIAAGNTLKVGVFLQPREGWHTYWENPGDAGIPTTFEVTLPMDKEPSAIEWPTPSRITEAGNLTVFGYKGDVFLPISIPISADYKAETLPIKITANWLVCHEICVPESAELELSVAVSKYSIVSDNAWRFERNSNTIRVDKPLAYSTSAKHITLAIPDTIKTDGEVYFFPRAENTFNYSAPQTLTNNTLKIARADNAEVPESLSGLLVVAGQTYDIRANPSAFAQQTPTQTLPQTHNILTLILFAMLGGLILNLMPCVLPVLSLKALAIAQKAAHERGIIVRQALAYTLGVIVSFALIAGLLIGLQQAGEVIGWGYQMQSPVFVGFLTVLLFVIGLNLAGMFELPVLFGSAMVDNHDHRLRGSFFTGVLATAVATPCTAPFMATAVGATITLPPIFALLVFLSIGFGLALPFLLIAAFPKLVRFLPKPGAWMEGFKQFLSFPMFASVVWLLWVITMQTGASGLLVILITLLSVVFVIWLKTRCKDASPLCRIGILLLLAAALINGLAALSKLEAPKTVVEHNTTAFSESALAELRSQGKAVFVDATAAWCLTCQVNKKIAIDTQASRQAFADTNTTLMIADWTNRNEEITAFLKHFGYNGVPLNVYYPAGGGEPVVLPQILSESLILSTLKGD